MASDKEGQVIFIIPGGPRLLPSLERAFTPFGFLEESERKRVMGLEPICPAGYGNERVAAVQLTFDKYSHSFEDRAQFVAIPAVPYPYSRSESTFVLGTC